MLEEKIISIHSNETAASEAIREKLAVKLEKEGYGVRHIYGENFDPRSQLLICIGGDGTILTALHKYNFPSVPIIGINTGHLGFFQEVESTQLDEFIFNYKNGKFRLQPLSTVAAIVHFHDGTKKKFNALNEIIIKRHNNQAAHLSLSIEGSFIEKFTGDGLVIATSAGSTAYNYSLGGSIVDPRLNLLQVTPIAPMNTTAYRSFTSSVLLPSDLHLDVIPDVERVEKNVVIADGRSNIFENVSHIEVGVSRIVVNLLRFEGYDFWTKVKSKFLI